MIAWQNIQLADSLEFFNGKACERGDHGHYPIYGSNGIIGYINRFMYEDGLVIGRVGAYCGSINRERGQYWASDNTIVAKAKSGYDTQFIYYLLSGYPLNSLAGGSAQPLLNQGILERIKVKSPPLPTQKKIAAILSAYDELIENNRRRIALLEKMAEEIYREWFVRLRFPGHEGVKIVKGVPEGWEVKSFAQFCELKRGYDLPKDQVEVGQYPVIASTSITAYHNRWKVEPPVITTGRSGSLGSVLLVQRRSWPLNTSLYVNQFFGNSPFLVFHTLKNLSLENFNSGSGVPTLNRNHLNGITLNVPDSATQLQFNEFASSIYGQIDFLTYSIDILARARDLLLPRLISGKLSVEDLDIAFPPGMAEEEPAAASQQARQAELEFDDHPVH